MVGRPYWRAGSGREALLEDQEWLRGPLGGLGVVGRLFQRARSGWEALPESREALSKGRKALLDGREALLEGRDWSGVPSGGLGVVEKPSRRAGSGREAHSKGL